jgi:IclR family KDG regulon transcriptional repressor
MGRAVPATSRALDILELFLDAPLLSAADVVTALGLPRTTVHELLRTLVDRKYLALVDGQPLRYQLGVRVFQLGNTFAEHLELVREAQGAAAEVAASCDETVHVGVLEGSDVIYLARVESTFPVRMVSAIGRRVPAHCTGLGKMLLSSLTPAAVCALYAGRASLPTMTPRSISTLSRLTEELADVRLRGLAFDDAESSEDVHCVSAGVRDHTGQMVAAMSISVPVTRWSDHARESLTTMVRRGAEQLSENLGYRR